MSKRNLVDAPLLQSIFSQYPEIQAVYLFGSTAAGMVHAESDLDLAIVSEPSLYKVKLDLLTELARRGFCQVDLLYLEKADPVLRYEAVRQNRLIYATQEFDRGAYYSQIVRHYLDLLPYLNVQREFTKRRLLHGTRRSSAQAVKSTGNVSSDST